MKMCACGKPLHYSNPLLQQLVEQMITEFGENMKITNVDTGKSYLVPKHFIALHGIKGRELAKLAEQYGFKEVPTT